MLYDAERTGRDGLCLYAEVGGPGDASAAGPRETGSEPA